MADDVGESERVCHFGGFERLFSRISCFDVWWSQAFVYVPGI